MKSKGWYGDTQRHAMASRGIKSLSRSLSKKYPKIKENLHFLIWYTPLQRERYDYEGFMKIQKELADPRYHAVEVWVSSGEYGNYLGKYKITSDGEFEFMED